MGKDKDKATTAPADYVIVGAGAMGMAFADVLLEHSAATIVMIDDRAAPGGHWNDAYPFVRLHQPACFYGVPSMRLGARYMDPTDLSSGHEVVDYYAKVLDKFRATGRLRFFAQCRFEQSDGRMWARSLITPEMKHEVRASVLVDTAYMNVQVPKTRPPQYQVGEDVLLGPINDLASIRSPYDHYTVIGAGKTGIDAMLYLLGRQVAPDRIRWVIPNDSWLVNREFFRSGLRELLPKVVKVLMKAVGKGQWDEYMTELEEAGLYTRLDPSVRPTKYKCAIVSPGELQLLRTLPSSQILRKGRVRKVAVDHLVLEGGTVPTPPGTFHVDCTSNGGGSERSPSAAVFTEAEEGQVRRITLRPVKLCQQVYSAAHIAFVEAGLSLSTEQKNYLCLPVNHPNNPREGLLGGYKDLVNKFRWARVPKLQKWIGNCRLNRESFQHLSATDQLRLIATVLPLVLTGRLDEKVLARNLRVSLALTDDLDEEQEEALGNSLFPPGSSTSTLLIIAGAAGLAALGASLLY